MNPTPSDTLEEQIGRIADQFLDRLHRGESPTVEEYAAAHPDLAGVLRDVLPLMGATGPMPVPVASVPERLGEFRIVREVGRGGMGVVYEAVQEPLGRRVALKVLPPGAQLHPGYLERFRREAKAAARLHHTHIVPVFGVGEAGGIHYYAMQFIDGVSWESFRREALPSQSLGSRRHDPRTIARWGLQAAEALAHAHAHGVLHRDIKPSNLLLDTQGDVWVTDFGLAKLADGDDLTGSGDFLGTLRYAAPECFRGPADGRGDVYSLGATLYELLTCRPAFDAVERDRLVRQIAEQEPTPLRRLDGRIPRDLETVVLKALAKEPARRYGAAQDLADDLRRFLEDRPVLARRPTLVNRLAKWARRHQAAVLTAGISIVLFLAGAVAALAVSNALVRRESDRKDEALVQVRQEKERADENLARARRAVENYLTQTAEDVQLKAANFYDLRKRLLTASVPFYEEFARQRHDDPEAQRQRADAYRLLAFVRAELGEYGPAIDHYEQARAIFTELGDAYRTDLAATLTSLGTALFRSDRGGESESAYRQALTLLGTLSADSPAVRKERGRASNHLGLLLFRAGRLPEAEAVYRQALETWQELTRTLPGDRECGASLALAHKNLSALLGQAGQATEAEALLRQAVAVQQKLVEDFPAVPAYRSVLAGYSGNHGWLLGQLSRRAEGIAPYRTALALQKKLADEYPNIPEYQEEPGRTRNNFAQLLRDLDRLADAETIDREAVAIRERLAAEAGSVGPATRLASRRLDLAYSLNGLAQTLRQHGPPAEAEAVFGRALALRRELAASGVLQQRNELASTAHEFGRFLVEQGRPAEAEAAYREAIALREQLAADAPNLPVGQQDASLAYSYFHLERVLSKQGRSAEADDAHRHAGAMVDKLAAGVEAPKVSADRAAAWRSRGHMLAWARRDREAGQAFRRAFELDGDNPRVLIDLADFLADCRDPECRNPAEAVALARRAVAQAPEDGTFWQTLGVALDRAGQWPESVTALHKSLDLRNGGSPADGFVLARALWRAGDREEARRRYDGAVRWTEANRPDDEDLRRARAEAAALLHVPNRP